MTYDQLRDQSLRIAAVFRELGVKEGDAVAICSENNLKFFPVVLATLFLGGTIAPVNPTYVARKFHKIRDSNQWKSPFTPDF
jgi:acyl-CoA synthetase (AMP-forming)/AMP-acid ligase II